MHVGVEKLRDRVQETMEQAIANCTKCSDELKAVMQEWIDNARLVGQIGRGYGAPRSR